MKYLYVQLNDFKINRTIKKFTIDAPTVLAKKLLYQEIENSLIRV